MPPQSGDVGLEMCFFFLDEAYTGKPTNMCLMGLPSWAIRIPKPESFESFEEVGQSPFKKNLPFRILK